MPASLSVLNRTGESNYVDAYSSQMIDIVGKAYMQDIALLGYAFDDAKPCGQVQGVIRRYRSVW